MNRTKLFIGIFIAFILIVLTIVLLACTVFVVRDVSIESDTFPVPDSMNEAQIIDSSGLSIGRSIISISKEKVMTSIEKANPYVEVLSITRVFPNKVIVKVTERKGLMLVASSTGTEYALIDSSLKVLNASDSAESLSATATLVTGVTFVTPESGVESLIGSKLTLDKPICADIIADITECAASYNFRAEDFSGLFTNIDFEQNDDNIVVYVHTIKGVCFVLDKSLQSDIFSQLAVCLNYYTTDQAVTIDYYYGYIYYNKESGGFAWTDSLD